MLNCISLHMKWWTFNFSLLHIWRKNSSNLYLWHSHPWGVQSVWRGIAAYWSSLRCVILAFTTLCLFTAKKKRYSSSDSSTETSSEGEKIRKKEILVNRKIIHFIRQVRHGCTCMWCGQTLTQKRHAWPNLRVWRSRCIADNWQNSHHRQLQAIWSWRNELWHLDISENTSVERKTDL